MRYLPRDLEKVFEPFETGCEPFREIKVAETVGAWLAANPEPGPRVELAARAETMAFSFSLSREEGRSQWGTYFGPLLSAQEVNGRMVTIRRVTCEMVNYWKGRSGESRHAVLRARYADLVWDLSKAVTGQIGTHQFGRRAVGAYVEATNKDPCRLPMVSVRRLRRALSLALSLRDGKLVADVRGSMLNLFRRNALPGKIGIWASLFDTLYGNKKVALSPGQQKDVIDTLEDLLKRTADRTNEDFHPFAAKEAAIRLGKHYGSVGRRDEITRVMRTWGMALKKFADHADPLFAMGWLEELSREYRGVGMKRDAEEVQIECKAKGKQAENNMKTMSFGVEIPDAQLNKFLDSMTDGGLNKALRRIALRFVVKRAQARRQLEEIAKDHPLLVDVRRVVLSEQQAIADVGPLDEDPEGQTALQMAQNIAFYCQFLVLCLERLNKRYNPSAKDVLEYLFHSQVLDVGRRSLLEKGLRAYLEGDHTTAVHILMPQIEHVIRRVVEEVGMPTNKPSRWAGMQEKNVYDMLGDLSRTQPALHEYLPYLRTLFTDPRGMNLRNRLCHGLMVPDDFSPQTSALVLHALLFLAQLRIEKEPPQDSPT